MTRLLLVTGSDTRSGRLEAAWAHRHDVAIVGTVDVTATPVEAIEAADPDVVIVDGDASDAERWTAELDGSGHRPAIVLLLDEDDADRLLPLPDIVGAVLSRDAHAGELAAAIDAAGAGLLVIDRRFTGGTWSARNGVAGGAAPTAQRRRAPAPIRFAEPDADGRSPPPLTPREAEVLAMMADGLANKNIAARLGISENTVKTHVAAVLTKLGAGSRAEAVAIGARAGVLLL